MTRTGYTFAGWKDNNQTSPAFSGVKQPGDTFAMPSRNVRVDAQWTINQYTVSYNSDGGTPTPISQTANYNSTITVAAAPSKTGNTFTGWQRSDTGAVIAAGGQMTIPATDVTLTAQWTARQSYSLWYNMDGGSPAVPERQVYVGDTVTVFAGRIPTKGGYTFVHYTASGALSGNYDPGDTFTMPAGNVTLTAIWQAAMTPGTIVFNNDMVSTVSGAPSVTVGFNIESDNAYPMWNVSRTASPYGVTAGTYQFSEDSSGNLQLSIIASTGSVGSTIVATSTNSTWKVQIYRSGASIYTSSAVAISASGSRLSATFANAPEVNPATDTVVISKVSGGDTIGNFAVQLSRTVTICKNGGNAKFMPFTTSSQGFVAETTVFGSGGDAIMSSTVPFATGGNFSSLFTASARAGNFTSGGMSIETDTAPYSRCTYSMGASATFGQIVCTDASGVDTTIQITNIRGTGEPDWDILITNTTAELAALNNAVAIDYQLNGEFGFA